MARINKAGKDKDSKEATVHQELKGLDLKINEFGQVLGNKSIEEINEFLNKHVTDKKIEERDGVYAEPDEEEQ